MTEPMSWLETMMWGIVIFVAVPAMVFAWWITRGDKEEMKRRYEMYE